MGIHVIRLEGKEGVMHYGTKRSKFDQALWKLKMKLVLKK